MELSGKTFGPEVVDISVRIGRPYRRPETGHWVCRAEIDGLAHQEWHFAADTEAGAERGLLADLHELLIDAQVELDPAAAAYLKGAAELPRDENNSPAIHQTEILIVGNRLKAGAEPETITARIHPAKYDEQGGIECQLDIDGLYEQPFMLSGVDFAQAREHAFMILEQIFEQNNVSKLK